MTLLAAVLLSTPWTPASEGAGGGGRPAAAERRVESPGRPWPWGWPLGRWRLRPQGGLPPGFVPAAVRARRSPVGRYLVEVAPPPSVGPVPAGGRPAPDRTPSGVAPGVPGARGALGGPGGQGSAVSRARRREAVLAEIRARGGRVVFRYGVLLNGFSAELSPAAVAALRRRPEVVAVHPVRVLRLLNETSVPFIGAPGVWRDLGARGKGVDVAVVDTGVDYTHRALGGSGDVRAYASNDPRAVEPGTFPTAKVVGGFDFVGETYDPDDPAHDVPVPDRDPLDLQGHGTHVAATCCGVGAPGTVGRGVAPAARIHALKVFSEAGSTTDDVLVAALERAADPNGDGRTTDHVDVVSLSLGGDYGLPDDPAARAARRLVRLGVVVVAAAGNAGNQLAGGSAYAASSPGNAPGVISVGASIDRFVATRLTVVSPGGLPLPDGGITVHQGWSAPLPAGGLTADLTDARRLDPPEDPGGSVTPADRQFCDPLPPGSLAGAVPVVFKGPTDDGDCPGSTKVRNAQEAGARAVVLRSGFVGLPFELGSAGEEVSIPAVMVSGRDGEALLQALSPSPPPYDAARVTVSLGDQPVELPEYQDAVTDFTSEGPVRRTSRLKPDVTAPGFAIPSAAAGTGDGAVPMSGTSMATPHVTGMAALLVQLHPGWSPARIRALVMNHATPALRGPNLEPSVPATVMGAGRVQAYESAQAVSLALPPSLSFGLRPLAGPQRLTRRLTVENHDRVRHRYAVSGSGRYTDLDPALASVEVSLDGDSFGPSRTFVLGPGRSGRVWVRLSVDPSLISPAEQELGWYFVHPNVDGQVVVRQSEGSTDTLRVPWHVVPAAASADRLGQGPLDLRAGPASLPVLSGPAAGTSHADVYLLGATDPVDGVAEEDIVRVGVRSFTGPALDGRAEGLPPGTDPLSELLSREGRLAAPLTWTDFLAVEEPPAEPVEFVVETASVHSVTDVLEVDVLVDAGADGVVADPLLGADYLVVKLAVPGGFVCVLDLSRPDPFSSCTAVYFPDYSSYDSDLVGIVVDARDIGVTEARPEFGYLTVAASLPSDSVPPLDVAGDLDPRTGTYASRFDPLRPALEARPLVCGGFWGGPRCGPGSPVRVARGSAGPGEDPRLLVVFPNNPPRASTAVVATRT